MLLNLLYLMYLNKEILQVYRFTYINEVRTHTESCGLSNT